MEVFYPAVFHEAEEGGFWVTFPDIEGCFTQGDTLESAFAMACDALFCYADGASEMPKPSNIKKIVKEQESDLVLLVCSVPYDEKDEQQKLISTAIENGLKNKGFNKRQVATILDVDRSYLTHIVKGERIPSVDFAKRIGVLLGFDWRVFYGDKA